MRILLLGDFNIVNTNLKRGLEANGCQVTVASVGDGDGDYRRDINLRSPLEGRWRRRNRWTSRLDRALNTLHCLRLLPRLGGYDVVQFVTYDAFGNVFFPLRFMRSVMRRSGVRALYSCGTDIALLEAAIAGRFRYTPFDDAQAQLRYRDRWRKEYEEFMSLFDTIIPATYSYAVAMERFPARGALIRFPFAAGPEPDIRPCQPGRPVAIYYCPRRAEFKGASHILDALELCRQRLGDKVELLVKERVPYDEYVKIMDRADILIDQCRSYSYGMNAVTGLARGKVVLSGAEPEAMQMLGVDSCPVVNITPDAEQIYGQIARLVADPAEINRLKRASRDYVARYHDAKAIAAEFLQAYQKAARP